MDIHKDQPELSPVEKEFIIETAKWAGFSHMKKNSFYFDTSTHPVKSMTSLYKKLGLNKLDKIENLSDLDPTCLKLAIGISSNNVSSNKEQAILAALKELSDDYFREKSQRLLNGFDNQLGGCRGYDYITSLVPVVNTEIISNKQSRLYLLDPANENRVVPKIDAKLYCTLLGEKEEEVIVQCDTFVRPVFNPLKTESYYKDPSVTVGINTFLNFYIPPVWRKAGASPKYHGKIKRFMEHLFPNEEERELVLDWMHYAIMRRNNTVLILVGSRGTGKTIMMQKVLGGLIGEEYVGIAKKDTLLEKFNSAFKNNRLVLFEEVPVQQTGVLDKLKAYCNDRISLETKGVDETTIENFSSMVLMLNYKNHLKIMPQERRFSIPKITSKKLTTLFSDKEINEFVKDISDPYSKTLAEFGEWLLQRKPTLGDNEAIKNDYFFEISDMNLPPWLSMLQDSLMSPDSKEYGVTVKDLRKTYKKITGSYKYFPKDRHSLEAYIDDYEYRGKCRICEMETPDGPSTMYDDIVLWPTAEFIREFEKYEEIKKQKKMNIDEEEEEEYIEEEGAEDLL